LNVQRKKAYSSLFAEYSKKVNEVRFKAW